MSIPFVYFEAMPNAKYILIYLPIYSCLLVEYSTEKCLFLGVSKYEKGVGYVYSKSKGRGHDNFF